MAIFREGSIIGAISGRLGGSVAVRARSGPVIRHRPAKVTTTTTAAKDARADFSNTAKDWRNLSAADIRAWATFAAAHPETNRLGVSRLLTGFQWFMRGSRVLWLQTANGVRLYLNITPVWEWSWTTETLFIHAPYEITTRENPTGVSHGPIGSQIWTDTLKIASLNAVNQVAALIDLTNQTISTNDITTRALADQTTSQVYALTNAAGTYFQARNPATLRLETYMFIAPDLTISLAGDVDTTQTLT